MSYSDKVKKLADEIYTSSGGSMSYSDALEIAERTVDEELKKELMRVLWRRSSPVYACLDSILNLL